jgi:IS1 family transposase
VVYVYCRESGEIVAFVWGNRDLKTARRVRRRVAEAGITCGCFATDLRGSFPAAFLRRTTRKSGKHTSGIEGNNCRLRHRERRAFRRICYFSRKIFYHLTAFSLVFFFINYGHV